MPKISKIDTNPQKIEEILNRGVHEVYTKDELREKLLSGKQLHLKLGTDVTGPLLHLGHSVVHRKLHDFQELGHKVTLIIGDFTTLVGDHSDKVDMRAESTTEQIKKDEQEYKQQFFKTVMEEQTEIRRNSEWLKDLDFNDVIHLAKQFTVSQLLEREAFMIRYKAQKPIGLDEFLYPLMQGYDSVALKCDVEFGGTDQTFNLLAGRKLMPVFGLDPQSAMVMKLLTGSDGRPMGKSLKNYIPVSDNPNDMFGKIMSIVDEVMFDYFELVTRIPMTEVLEMKQAVDEDGENPMKFKKILAKDIVTFYHGPKKAVEAEKEFENTVQNKEVTETNTTEVSNRGKMSVLEFLKLSGASKSNSHIKEVIKQGGVEVDGKKATDFNKVLDFKSGMVVKFGKRTYFRVK
ncbi:tyrosine--tRNA ligase [candidate division WWE3 bacterium RIFCSPLOWO2_01_FULL_37_24]|nr:MAG: tyrosine--tRNA ligase [candidate division WWE3 bacterium RIFCSPHIGHO2_01_FULL_38_45]OGC53109.1 MAG: tyrosine--tRNA ligase [candidate division WWE3 bacterium RIFCSPLOWO2_01_FULL_37_24]HLB51948.1 tyrosine--tRNA ligase [Patescibacteria group bacterium]